MHRIRVGCLVMLCLLVVLLGCSNGRAKIVERVARIESYSISSSQPTTITLHLIAGIADHLRGATVVQETSGEVEVKAVVTGPDPRVGGDAVGAALTADVTPRSELGHRKLIDAKNGKIIPALKR